MKSQTFWILLVSLPLVCGLIGCGKRPQRVVGKPQAVVEKPKLTLEDLKAVVSDAQKECSERLGQEVVVANGIGMKMVLIPPGEFMMGWSGNKVQPQRKVRITKPFYLGVYEVTQAEYEEVMGKDPNPSARADFKGADLPVFNMSWEDATEFCRRLSAKEGMTYRLPTEAEWEYACRAGTTTLYSFGDDPADLGDYAWYEGNSDGTMHPGGQKKPNAWGLYDMHGGVSEWCADLFGGDAPSRPEHAGFRVKRGGNWYWGPVECWSAYSSGISPDRHTVLGFRVAADPSGK